MVALAAALLALPLQFGPEILQPRSYASPSGRWTVHVDPSSRFGDGPARLRAERDGALAWERELGVTPWSAEVTEDGAFAGWGFSEGPASWEGALHVLVLSPSGELLLDEAYERTGSTGPHSPQNPRVLGTFVHPDLDLFVVRVIDEVTFPGDEAWWSYRTSTGEKLSKTHPKRALDRPRAVRGSIDAKPVPGTPLTLVHWYRTDFAAGEPRARFVLCDASWRPMREVELPADLGPSRTEATGPTANELWYRSALPEPDEARSFALRDPISERCVRYALAPDDSALGGWSLREVERMDCRESGAPSPHRPEPLPRLDLPLLSTVPIQSGPPPPSSPVRDIVTFEPDKAGRVQFVREEGEVGEFTLVTVDPGGDVLRELRLEPLGPDRAGHRSWRARGGGDWVCSLRPGEEGAPPRAWRIDGESGAATEVEASPYLGIEELVPMPDGGFVTLGWNPEARLAAYDAKGGLRWELWESFEDDPGALATPEDLAVTSEGEIVVLDNIAMRLQVYDSAGTYLRSVELTETWATEACYLTDLLVEPGGTFLVRDSHDDTWHRTTPEGAESARILPRRGNGSPHVGERSMLRAAPNGELWTTDGHELLVLDERGVARPRVGTAPDPSVLAEPRGVFFDGRGRVAVADERTRAVHIFDAQGARALVCAPDPSDFGFGEDVDRVQVAPDGGVFLHTEDSAGSYLEHEASGARLGWTATEGELLAFDPRDGACWRGTGSMWGPTFVRKRDLEGEEAARVGRRPDGAFFESIEAIACGPDGTLAVLERLLAGGCALSLFAPDGTPRRRMPIGFAQRGGTWHLHLGHRWAVAHSYMDRAVVISLADGRAAVVEVPETPGFSAFTLSPDETELWCATSTPLALHRYALPR